LILTERKIERLTVEPGRRDRLVFDDEQRGLAVRVTASGGQTYLCQYTLHGRKWRVPLGACSALALSKARKAAAAVMGEVAHGKNPAADRKEAAAAEQAKRARDRLTLRALIEDWQRLHLATRRPSYAAEAVRALHHAFAKHLDSPAEDLDRASVVRTLDALSRRGTGKNGEEEPKPKGAAMTARTAAYARAAFSWAERRGALEANPFENLPVEKSVAKRDRVLSDQELGEIWRAAGEVALPYGAIVRLLTLTGQRKSEVAAMAWTEISDDLTTWTIPGARTKNGVPHIVPLSEPARDLLCTLPRLGELVLPGERSTPFGGWSKAKVRLDTASGISGWRLHDLRRTLATGLQRLGVRLEVTEAVLNHISGSRAGIVGIYQRHDWQGEKRAALEGWAAHVVSVARRNKAVENVLPFRATAG
jgi:integrase